MSQKCHPSILQQNGCSKNPRGSPLLHFSTLCDLPETSEKLGNFFPHSGTVEENTRYFEVLLLFLSLIWLRLGPFPACFVSATSWQRDLHPVSFLKRESGTIFHDKLNSVCQISDNNHLYCLTWFQYNQPSVLAKL